MLGRPARLAPLVPGAGELLEGADVIVRDARPQRVDFYVNTAAQLIADRVASRSRVGQAELWPGAESQQLLFALALEFHAEGFGAARPHQQVQPAGVEQLVRPRARR